MNSRRKSLLFAVLFIVALAFLSPPPGWGGEKGMMEGMMQKKGRMKPLEPAVYKVEDILKKGLDQKAGGLNYSIISATKTGSVELFRIEEVKTHFHAKENHFLYILQGRAKGKIGDITAEVGPGDLVVIPAGKKYKHSFTKIGDEPVVFLLFSTPPFHAKDIVWVEE